MYLGSVLRPTLVILGGLPAVGKSTVASVLNKAGRFAYVRIDSIEQAIQAREYEAWESADLRIDTSTVSPCDAAALIRAAIS